MDKDFPYDCRDDFVHSGRPGWYEPGQEYRTFCGEVRKARLNVNVPGTNNYKHVTCPKCLRIIDETD